jgi:hypothetical protein
MTQNTPESPIVGSPIITTAATDSPIIGSPIIGSDEPLPDFNDACAAGMPAGHRMFYFKFVAAVIGVLGSVGFVVFKLLDHLGFLT